MDESKNLYHKALLTHGRVSAAVCIVFCTMYATQPASTRLLVVALFNLQKTFSPLLASKLVLVLSAHKQTTSGYGVSSVKITFNVSPGVDVKSRIWMLVGFKFRITIGISFNV